MTLNHRHGTTTQRLMSHQADPVLGREIEELLLREVPEPQLDEHLAAVGFQGHPRVELNLDDGGNNASDLKDPLGFEDVEV